MSRCLEIKLRRDRGVEFEGASLKNVRRHAGFTAYDDVGRSWDGEPEGLQGSVVGV